MGVKGEGRASASVLILGIDGYIGWPLANHLARLGYEIVGIDSYFRRQAAVSLIPLESTWDRQRKFQIHAGVLDEIKAIAKVDAIIHLAEQPSAPWSMKNYAQAAITQRRNVLGTLNLLWMMKEFCPEAHLIKLGTMGEYGTPDCSIPEGFIEDGPMKGLPFPRQAGSFYHLSKVFDSQNIEFACRTWGLRSTDIMQGIVFGVEDDTRFDYDECFGTVLNRFCAQAVAGIPLTIYGCGKQTRGFLPLRDSLECLTLALQNPPLPGEYRVFNQFARVLTVDEVAEAVSIASVRFGIETEVQSIKNPRKEKEDHIYFPKSDNLRKLGYNPKWSLTGEIANLLEKILPYRDLVKKEIILPKIRWCG